MYLRLSIDHDLLTFLPLSLSLPPSLSIYLSISLPPSFLIILSAHPLNKPVLFACKTPSTCTKLHCIPGVPTITYNNGIYLVRGESNYEWVVIIMEQIALRSRYVASLSWGKFLYSLYGASLSVPDMERFSSFTIWSKSLRSWYGAILFVHNKELVS